MIKRVLKFPLSTSTNTIELQGGSRVVLIALDPASGEPAIWLEVTECAMPQTRTFRVYGTGAKIFPGDPVGGTNQDIHVGSVIQGPYVWHVYERFPV